ncbi:MAG: radical SAM protein [Candidatus Hydrothermales bacterium]
MKCKICNKDFDYLTRILRICKSCLIENFENIKEELISIHRLTREKFELTFPTGEGEIKCKFCARECPLSENERGFCGLREYRNKKFINYSNDNYGFFQFYYDPLPTNCVADWICKGHTAYGKYNLAVFYETCSLNCLYCQNYHFRYRKPWKEKAHSYVELLRALNPVVFCVCFFGGDPTTQAIHSIKFSEEAIKMGKVICYESNGMWNKNLLLKILEIVKESGGILKFDIKAYSKEVYFALTGYDGKKVFENLELAVNYLGDLSSKHLCASTLMVPGYIDEYEISGICEFISKLNPSIPYALLAFAPHFEMSDARRNYKSEAYRFYEIVKSKGLKNVRIGNFFLLLEK